MRLLDAWPATLGSFSLGEGPFWDAQRSQVGWVDITVGAVHRGMLDHSTIRTIETFEFTTTVGCAVPTEDGGLLVACGTRLAVIDSMGEVRTGPELAPRGGPFRFNDGACDPAGRFFVGTMSLDGRQGEEALYRLTSKGEVEVVFDGLTLSNGLAWSPDAKWLYLVDSVPRVVWKISYDLPTADLGEATPLLHFDGPMPDGLCVDADGNLWVALWGAGEVRCFSAKATPLACVRVPAPNTTSAAFVGTELDRLLITTARHDLTSRELSNNPHSGRIFLVDPETTGTPVSRFTGDYSQWSWAPLR